MYSILITIIAVLYIVLLVLDWFEELSEVITTELNRDNKRGNRWRLKIYI